MLALAAHARRPPQRWPAIAHTSASLLSIRLVRASQQQSSSSSNKRAELRIAIIENCSEKISPMKSGHKAHNVVHSVFNFAALS
jgi:hypothetical protein